MQHSLRATMLLMMAVAASLLYGQKAEIVQAGPSVNPYIGQRWYASGDVVTIWGKNLATSTALTDFSMRAKQLGGISLYYIPDYNDCSEMWWKPRDQRDPWKVVQACGQALDLVYVSPGQVNFLLPWGTPVRPWGRFSSGGLIADTDGDYHGFLALVRDGAVPDLYLGRMYSDSDAWWNVYPFDISGGAKPSFAIWGYTRPYASIEQRHEVVTFKDVDHPVPFPALTHADYSIVSSEKPVKNGDYLTIWATGLGDMQPCGQILCAASDKSAALTPYISFQVAGKSYFFPLDVTFVGSTAEFPWLQQVNARVRICTEGRSANTPQIIDGRLYFTYYSEFDGWTDTPGFVGVSVPVLLSGAVEAGLTGYVYQSVPQLGGLWQQSCVVY